MEFKLTPFQDDFVFSRVRFPLFCAGVGTGKTLAAILRMFNLMEEYPNNLGIIVRRDYTDLFDSTIKDIIRYTGRRPNSHKEIEFDNGSTILLRHGTEIETLKNINAGAIFIEQADEFPDDEVFQFLRDRLRRQEATYKSIFLTANANGHNWIWRMWVNNPASEDFKLWTATTFDNAENLPEDFIKDLKRMEKEAPNHYKQYVLNSFEELGADDLLLTGSSVYPSPNLTFYEEGTQRRILSVDVARFGEDETVFTIIQSKNIRQWEQIYQHTWRNKDLMQIVGKVLDLKREFNPHIVAIDDCGIGGGVTDRLSEQRHLPEAFIGNEKPNNELYQDKRSEGFFRLKEFFDKGDLKIINDNQLIEQLLSIKYKFKSNGKKAIISKDEMRKDGLKSPDRADALCMAVYYTDRIFNERLRKDLPRFAEMNT